MWLDAPTVSTHGALPGAVMPPYCVTPSRFAAVVAGRRDDHDARLDRALGGERQRIGRCTTRTRPRDRQVDDADVERVLVRDDVVERGDDVADAAAARRVEHLEHDQMRAGRDARCARRSSRSRCPR